MRALTDLAELRNDDLARLSSRKVDALVESGADEQVAIDAVVWCIELAHAHGAVDGMRQAIELLRREVDNPILNRKPAE
jgi:hypothetical protein